MATDTGHLDQPVTTVARTDVATLGEGWTIQEALTSIRERGVGEKIVYFYVVDGAGRLVGVLPTRRLLTASLDRRVSEVMLGNVVSIPSTATVMEACEAFVVHRFLAFPVVDPGGGLVGVVDAGLLTEEALDVAERQAREDVFDRIGVRLAQLRDASPLRGFRFRFPWLLATIASGTACAWLSGLYEATLSRSLVLAFFMTLVLGLGESVSIQSMTVAIQSLRGALPTMGWYGRALARELGTAFLLGAGCGLVVGGIVWLWRGDPRASVAIGGSIVIAMVAACFFGLTVPSLLHALRLDPKIAAGPVTLALADMATLLSYFGMATWLL